MAKKYSCSECGGDFTRKWSTERHITNKDEGVGRVVALNMSVSTGSNTTIADTRASIEARSSVLFAEEYLRQIAKRLADSVFERAGMEKLEETIATAVAMYVDAKEQRLDLSHILEYRREE